MAWRSERWCLASCVFRARHNCSNCVCKHPCLVPSGSWYPRIIKRLRRKTRTHQPRATNTVDHVPHWFGSYTNEWKPKTLSCNRVQGNERWVWQQRFILESTKCCDVVFELSMHAYYACTHMRAYLCMHTYACIHSKNLRIPSNPLGKPSKHLGKPRPASGN